MHFVCRPYLVKVVSHDLSVLSMSVMGLQKMGYFGGCVGVESYINLVISSFFLFF